MQENRPVRCRARPSRYKDKEKAENKGGNEKENRTVS